MTETTQSRSNAVFMVAHHTPLSGYFTGVFALPGPDGPPNLRGPFDELASAVRRSPESTVYRFDAFADVWARLGAERPVICAPAWIRVVDIPWVDRDGPPMPFAPHPATIAHIVDLAPLVRAFGVNLEELRKTRQERVAETDSVHIFECEWEGSESGVRGWCEVESRANFVRWTLMPMRKDRQALGSTNFTWPSKLIRTEHHFGSASAVTVIVPTSNENEYERIALLNAESCAGRPWPGIAHNWSTMLLQPVVRGTLRIAQFAPFDFTPNWGGRDNPNATGVDPSYGATWTAPLFPSEAPPSPHILTRMRPAISRYASRPCHWLEPGTIQRLRVVDGRQLTLHKGQPYERAEADVLGIGTQFKGDGFTDYWTPLGTYDHEHRSVAPLAVYCVLTGDLWAHHIADSYLAAECYERSVANGWVQGGRGQALPWIAGKLLQRITNDNDLVVAWDRHNAKRIEQYRRTRMVSPDVIVGGVFRDGSPWGGGTGAFFDPYEQSLLVTALMLNGHVQDAFEHGRGLVTGLWWSEDGICHAAYNQRWIDGPWPHPIKVGQPLNDDLRAGGEALGTWIGAGLRSFVLAADRLSRLGDPRVQMALVALRDLDKTLPTIQQDGELFAAAHRSGYGTVIDVIRPPEGSR